MACNALVLAAKFRKQFRQYLDIGRQAVSRGCVEARPERRDRNGVFLFYYLNRILRRFYPSPPHPPSPPHSLPFALLIQPASRLPSPFFYIFLRLLAEIHLFFLV